MARSARRISAILLLLSLLAALDTFAWLGMQHALSRALSRASAAGAEAGWRMATSPAARGGWPFAATLTANLRLSGHGMTWSGERLELSRSLWHPRRFTLLARGAQILSLDGGEGNVADSVRVQAARLAVQLPVSWRRERMIRFDGDAMRMALPVGGSSLALTVAHLQGWVGWTPQATAVTLALDHAVWAGGGRIASARVQASLIARPARLLLSEAALRWPDARISLSGDAWFPRAGSRPPIGRFTARVVGADALLQREAAAGAITRAEASAIRAVLGLIAEAKDAPPGTPTAIPPLDLPLALHDGWLWLGQIPLWQIGLPPLPLP